MALTITDDNFEELLNSGTPLVIDFWAEWCGPCRTIAPIVEELAKEYEGKINIGKMDVDANPDTCAKYGIMSIPTILFFKGGELADKTVGMVPKSKIEEKLNAIL